MEKVETVVQKEKKKILYSGLEKVNTPWGQDYTEHNTEVLTSAEQQNS